ncbi:MAG: hypothetical protein ABIG63_05755 [Chloroflexota bacterium]
MSPNPPLRQLLQPLDIWLLWLLKFLPPSSVPGLLSRLPLRPPLGQDTRQQFLGGFQLGLVGLTPFPCQFPLNGGFEHRLPVALERSSGLLQLGHARLQLGEEFLDFGDDAFLFREWGNRYFYCVSIVSI